MASSSNYIALLNERTQKTGLTYRFEDVDTKGPDHSKIFTVRAVVNNKPYPEGVGRNKKEARQNAAKNALSLIQEEEPASTAKVVVTSPCSLDGLPKLTQANFTCWLNEYGQKMRLNFKFVESMPLDSNNQIQYACKFVCGDKEYPTAVCRVKRDAKEEAAKLVYKAINGENNAEVPGERTNETQQPSMSDLGYSLTGLSLSHSLSESSGLDNNFKGLLNHYCQKSGQAWDFKLVDKRGPAHNPEFVYKVIINKIEYPEGRGKTAKQSQQRAAELAWNTLLRSDSQTSSMSSDSKDESPSFASTLESKDDTSSKTPPISQDSRYSVEFKDSSAHPLRPAPVQSPVDFKNKESKIRLAANFPNSPNVKQDKPPVIKPSKPSAGSPASNSTVKSKFFLENFNSISKLGKGGFGSVFKARKVIEQKDYAVKIVKCTSKALREVAALAKLVHPNIVRYHTSWIEETAYQYESSESSTSTSSSEGSFLYIQMELCEGDTLQFWIATENTKDPSPERRQEAAKIMTQVLKAVEYIHSVNLIHRDLKPANIMFTKEKVLKVGDFGLVTAAETDSDEALLERTNRTGTPSYMSPEQVNQSSYDKKVDIFPLGLIYFELLWNLKTGHEKAEVWKDVRSRKLPEDFSKKFMLESKLIEQMLSANPEERPDASDLLTKLDAFKKPALRSDQNTKNENRTY
ncbi:interferon-induced, double-stranded RNA-activated protein kinase isoform X1 [Astyanax mexicanus]|uniref:interferon-induced, double-stranded RNA-activated protein kinase isoform X1 n=1 Tax=Astyanax mexicanus TaxID=7994 RepID=UPI0020CB26F8|nr:interferon-induced, double-stranded RNA-activated protein kinase isoform X1 [Astyanax mexicanus]